MLQGNSTFSRECTHVQHLKLVFYDRHVFLQKENKYVRSSRIASMLITFELKKRIFFSIFFYSLILDEAMLDVYVHTYFEMQLSVIHFFYNFKMHFEQLKCSSFFVSEIMELETQKCSTASQRRRMGKKYTEKIKKVKCKQFYMWN